MRMQNPESYPKRAIIRNCLIILYSKQSLLPEEQALYNRMCKEIRITREEMLSYYAEWQKEPGILIPGETNEENALLLSFMTAAAYFDNKVYSGERNALLAFARMTGISESAVSNFLANTWNFAFPASVLDDVYDIRTRLGFSPAMLNKTEGTPSNGLHQASGNQANNAGSFPAAAAPGAAAGPNQQGQIVSEYVATQVTNEGIDELQALYLCYKMRLNAALSGPPGVGKTESVLELSRILEIPLFTKVCSSRTTESHIISHPVLIEKNGVTITAHEDGALSRAMLAPGIFYGDEYNLLKEDIQKRMNSAFDDRRSIDRNDGSLVNAKPGFMAVISYNPSDGMGMRDLEDSVADRFVHFHYEEWPSELKAFISVLKAERKMGKPIPDYRHFGVNLVQRGFDQRGGFLEMENGAWVDFFTGARAAEAPRYQYFCLRKKHLGDRTPASKTIVDNLGKMVFDYSGLSHSISRFVGSINELARGGKSINLADLGLGAISESGDYEQLSVHPSSTRIITAALMHNRYCAEHGWNPYLAQSYSINLVINQIAYGNYRNLRVCDIANIDILATIARSMGLLGSSVQYNTGKTAKQAADGSSAAGSSAGGPSASGPSSGGAAAGTGGGKTTGGAPASGGPAAGAAAGRPSSRPHRKSK